MKRLLIALAVLVSANCCAMHVDLESVFDPNYDFGRSKRYVVTADLLLGVQDKTQKDMFKVCLSIESALLENDYTRSFQGHEYCLKLYEQTVENMDVNDPQRAFYLGMAELYKEIVVKDYEMIQRIRLLTAELMSL